ncbi:hypothetical protein [Actinomadura alba]|uniref:ANTAR domain-containing protein n=1 Tax=Actinomadura alba TaxID=406431 RepID=A0ABR7LYE5_9ACTN|nr:hypothetical protein [Actinomadura alba]MBC6469781.1 hypothetical protein [Actinomadura alba]
MSRQIAFGARGPSPAVLEERIRRLEARTVALAEAVRLLTYALAGTRQSDPGEIAVSQAVREAHGLLTSSR